MKIRGVLSAVFVVVALVAALLVGTASTSASDSRAARQGVINGRIAFQAYPNGFPELYTIKAKGGGRTRLTHNQAYDSAPAWAPGGTVIAFQFGDGSDVEIYTMYVGISGNNPQAPVPVTNNAVNDFHPTWSPTGQRLAFARDDGNDLEIFTVRLDGSGLRQLTDNNGDDLHPDWAPFGRNRIAFDHVRANDPRIRDPDIWVVKPDGTHLHQVTHNRTYDADASFAPNGKRITYQGCNRHECQIFIKPIAGGERRQFTHQGNDHSGPSWSPQGDWIVYAQGPGDGQHSNLYKKRVVGGHPRQITFTPRLFEENPDWGRKLFI